MYIRLARQDDAGSIAALHVASWRATYRDECSAEFLEGLDVDERAANWGAEIKGGMDVVVADDGGELVGFVACGATRDDVTDGADAFEIYNLHVAPGRQGLGIGRALFEQEETPESRGAQIAGATLLGGLIVLAGFWFFMQLGERAATITAQRQFGSAPVAEGNIGSDREARSWRLGLAYGLALVEERAGDTAKRDEYFELARRALRDAGAKDTTDASMRACVQAGQGR